MAYGNVKLQNQGKENALPHQLGYPSTQQLGTSWVPNTQQRLGRVEGDVEAPLHQPSPNCPFPTAVRAWPQGLGLAQLPDKRKLGILEDIEVGGTNLSTEATRAVGRGHRGS